jgi:hypothetical protein
MSTYLIRENKTTIFEGEAVVFSIQTTAVANGTVLYWSTETVSGTINSAAFTDSQLSGQVTVQNNQTLLTRVTTVVPGVQTKQFRIILSTGSVGGPTVATSATVTVQDSSLSLSIQTQSLHSPKGFSIGVPPRTIISDNGDAVYNNLIVEGNLTVLGSLTRLDSDVEVTSNTISLNATLTPEDAGALNGGLVLKGDTDKSILWTEVDEKTAWTANQNFNLTTGNEYRINDTLVVNSTTLGAGVTNSSLQTLGIINTGTWQASVISSLYGGTGVNNQGRTITIGGNFTHTGNHTLSLTTTANTSLTLPTTGTLISSTDEDTVTNAMIVNKGITVNGVFIALGESVTTEDTSYSISAETASSTTRLRLTSSQGSNDDVIFAQGTNIEITRTDADTITFATVASPSFTNTTISTLLTSKKILVDGAQEKFTQLTAATGTVVHNYNSTNVFYHTSMSANFVANFTNVPTTADNSIVFVLLLNQGATPRFPTGIQINSSNVTVKWQGGSVPAGNANSLDAISYIVIRRGAAWEVYGSAVSYA